MKLKFVVDKIKDKEMTSWVGCSKKTLDYMENQYKTSKRFIKLSQKLYQKSWDEINDDFSNYVEKETGYEWFHREYSCVLSVINPGISNWGNSNLIARHWKENPYFMRRITAHELILSHYFHIIKNHYEKENLKEGQIWALAEIAAFALTSLNPKVKKWWPWNTEYYTNHNYPHLVKLQLKMKNVFLKRKSFDEYIKEGIKIIKRYPKMSPNGK